MAGVQVVGDVRALQDHGDVEHGQVDVLPLAGAHALEEGGGDGEGSHGSRGVVDHGRPGLDRPAGLGAGRGRDA
jgi:hypothetical protein